VGRGGRKTSSPFFCPGTAGGSTNKSMSLPDGWIDSAELLVYQWSITRDETFHVTVDSVVLRNPADLARPRR
jgi:hypothetical protein